MNTTMIRVALPALAVLAVACNRADDRAGASASNTVTMSERAGEGGQGNETITVSGCVVRVEPDGYALAALDDAIVREERGTSGVGEPTKPTRPNRGAEEERARHGLNVSAEFTRYHLTGDSGLMATFVDREVDIRGRLQPDDGRDDTPMTVAVESIQETGASCGARQDQGNDRGALPTQDWPRKTD
jgi:hypothetical protein